MPLSSYQKASIFKAILLVAGLGYMAFDFYRKGRYGLIIVIVMGAVALGVIMIKGKPKGRS
jgi:F0F1-type ATP synthase assembly protein I